MQELLYAAGPEWEFSLSLCSPPRLRWRGRPRSWVTVGRDEDTRSLLVLPDITLVGVLGQPPRMWFSHSAFAGTHGGVVKACSVVFD